MQCRSAKSFVDDLGFSRGVVLSRAATILRSIETQPPTGRFVVPYDTLLTYLRIDSSVIMGPSKPFYKTLPVYGMQYLRESEQILCLGR